MYICINVMFITLLWNSNGSLISVFYYVHVNIYKNLNKYLQNAQNAYFANSLIHILNRHAFKSEFHLNIFLSTF